MTYLEKSNNSVCQSSAWVLHDTVFSMQSVGLTERQIYKL